MARARSAGRAALPPRASSPHVLILPFKAFQLYATKVSASIGTLFLAPLLLPNACFPSPRLAAPSAHPAGLDHNRSPVLPRRAGESCTHPRLPGVNSQGATPPRRATPPLRARAARGHPLAPSPPTCSAREAHVLASPVPHTHPSHRKPKSFYASILTRLGFQSPCQTDRDGDGDGEMFGDSYRMKGGLGVWIRFHV